MYKISTKRGRRQLQYKKYFDGQFIAILKPFSSPTDLSKLASVPLSPFFKLSLSLSTLCFSLSHIQSRSNSRSHLQQLQTQHPLPLPHHHPLPPAIRSIRNVFIDIDLLALPHHRPWQGGRRDEIYGWHLANGNGGKMQMAKQYAKIYSVICNLHEI